MLGKGIRGGILRQALHRSLWIPAKAGMKSCAMVPPENRSIVEPLPIAPVGIPCYTPRQRMGK